VVVLHHQAVYDKRVFMISTVGFKEAAYYKTYDDNE